MAQLKSTNITGNLAVTGNALASKIIKSGGTTHELLLADGSIAKISSTAQTTAPNAVTNTNARTYIVQKNGDQLVVNVPWVAGSSGGLTEIAINSGTGLSGGGTIDTSGGSVTLNHSNSVTAVTTASLLKLKYDAQGHITGTTSITKADITGLGIPSDDTGATSIEVTGNGEAIVNASYDEATRKITLTKGGFFVSEVASTDNAVVRFDGVEGSIQDSGIFINDDKQLDVSAGSIKLNTIYAPSSSGGTTYTTGTNNYVLKSNGTTVYWSYDTNAYTSAYCTTPSSTAKKAASCSNYTISQSSHLHIIMAYANTAASKLTLNVNSQGEKPIYINGVISSATNYTLPAGSYIIYYDGANYYFRTDGSLTANITGSSITCSKILVPTTSGGTTYGVGTDGQVLKSNGTTVYWGTSAEATYNNATTTTDGLMSADDKKNLTYYVKGTQTGATNAWTGSLTQISALYEGLTIRYRLPYAGTSSGATLNLTLSSGATGAKKVYRLGTSTQITTHFGAGSVITMTYDGTNWIVDAFYDSNNYANVRQYQHGQNAAGATNKYPLLARYNLTNKNGSYDTSYSRFHTEAYVDISDGSLTAKGFKYNDATKGTDGYVLLAGGGAKSLNDFDIGVRYEMTHNFDFLSQSLSISDIAVQNNIRAASILVGQVVMKEGFNIIDQSYGTFYRVSETEHYIHYGSTNEFYWNSNDSRAYLRSLRYNKTNNTFTWTPDA